MFRIICRRIFVNSRKLVNMVLKTVVIGGLVWLFTSFIVAHEIFSNVLNPFQGMEILGVFLYYLGFALVFTVVSLAGFLAYLFIHRFGVSIFRSFWPVVQILLAGLALFDIVYFSNKDILLVYRIIIMLVVLGAALLVGWLKVRQTNINGLIPTLFFMIVVTALELTLGLRTSGMEYIIIILVTLIVANAYQIMTWYHVTRPDEKHMKRIEERRRKRLERYKQEEKERKKKEEQKSNKTLKSKPNNKKKINKRKQIKS